MNLLDAFPHPGAGALCLSLSPLPAHLIGGWELVLIAAIVLILLGTRHLPGGSIDFFQVLLDAWKRLRDRMTGTNGSSGAKPGPLPSSSSSPAPGPSASPLRDELMLWLALGFDVGRIPFAPGTFGSMIGLLWFAILLVPGSLGLYLLGTAAGIVVSIGCCGRAEQLLNRTDPPSVVLDEIIAIPICFLPWVLRASSGEGVPQLETFVSHGAWASSLILFASSTDFPPRRDEFPRAILRVFSETIRAL